LRTDSGGAGRHRGGLGQWSEISSRGEGLWGVSALVDRTRYPTEGLEGGRSGAAGEIILSDGTRPQPKALTTLQPDMRVQLNPPGGGGYGDPRERPAEQVLADVVGGYVSIAAAEREYGVVVRYLGAEDQLVRLPEHYAIDWEATERGRRKAG
jgi:N-methylhydantoinase B